MDALLSLRKQLTQVGVKVSVNDFVIKAVALALRQCPYMNTLYINNQVNNCYFLRVLSVSKLYIKLKENLATVLYINEHNVKNINMIVVKHQQKRYATIVQGFSKRTIWFGMSIF